MAARSLLWNKKDVAGSKPLDQSTKNHLRTVTQAIESPHRSPTDLTYNLSCFAERANYPSSPNTIDLRGATLWVTERGRKKHSIIFTKSCFTLRNGTINLHCRQDNSTVCFAGEGVELYNLRVVGGGGLRVESGAHVSVFDCMLEECFDGIAVGGASIRNAETVSSSLFAVRLSVTNSRRHGISVYSDASVQLAYSAITGSGQHGILAAMGPTHRVRITGVVFTQNFLKALSIKDSGQATLFNCTSYSNGCNLDAQLPYCDLPPEFQLEQEMLQYSHPVELHQVYFPAYRQYNPSPTVSINPSDQVQPANQSHNQPLSAAALLYTQPLLEIPAIPNTDCPESWPAVLDASAALTVPLPDPAHNVAAAVYSHSPTFWTIISDPGIVETYNNQTASYETAGASNAINVSGQQPDQGQRLSAYESCRGGTIKNQNSSSKAFSGGNDGTQEMVDFSVSNSAYAASSRRVEKYALWVGNLPQFCPRRALKRFFGKGATSVRFQPIDEENWAIVKFINHESAAWGISRHGKDFMNRLITVKQHLPQDDSGE